MTFQMVTLNNFKFILVIVYERFTTQDCMDGICKIIQTILE